MDTIAYPSPAAIDFKDNDRGLRRARVWAMTDGHCWYCGVALDPVAFDVDHFHPIAKGGSGLRGNLVPACPSCNRGKRDRSLEEYRALKARKRDGTPLFSVEQHEWLAAHGFAFPTPEPYRFWFEIEGLEP